MKPEESARIKIDEQLFDAGWHIADRNHFTYDYNAIALVEALLNGNKEADYLLFVDGKVIGVLEAKRNDIDLEFAAGEQAAHYANIIPKEYPCWSEEPKVILLANGEKILLRDSVSGEYNPISTMPTPKKEIKIAMILPRVVTG